MSISAVYVARDTNGRIHVFNVQPDMSTYGRYYVGPAVNPVSSDLEDAALDRYGGDALKPGECMEVQFNLSVRDTRMIVSVDAPSDAPEVSLG